MRRSHRRRGLSAAAVLAIATVLLPVGSATALQSKSGTKNCGLKIAAAQATYLGGLSLNPPGGGTYYFASGAWATVARDGNYSGYWVASADNLSFASTYAFCRNYG